MSGLWAGIDVGGRRKGFHVAVIDERRLVDGPGRAGSVSDAANWIAKFEPQLTAVDSPIAPAPDGQRSRPCEREFLAARICGIRPTPDRATIVAREDGFYEWIEQGFELYAALRTAGLTAIECFPTASWTRWAGPRAGLTRARWTRAAVAALGLEGVPVRTSQDERDAIAAALTAREHTLELTQAFAEIVVPLP